MKLNKGVPYNGFSHDKVNKMLSGDLTFLNEFCVLGEYQPVAVYRAANPDASKGHKRYVLVQVNPNIDPVTMKRKKGGLIRGMDEKEMEKWRFQAGIHCKVCDEVIYSKYRHDMTYCSCGNEKGIAIDGGRDYTRVVGTECPHEFVMIDLLTDKIEVTKLEEDAKT